jgi:hypothetical protein
MNCRQRGMLGPPRGLGLALQLLLRGALAASALTWSVATTLHAQEVCETYQDPTSACPLTNGDVLRPIIGVRGGRNYFSFAAPTPDMQVQINVDDLPADYDLYLFSDQADDPDLPIASSVDWSTLPRQISVELHEAGTYLVEVVDDPSAPNAPEQAYTLQFLLTAPARPSPSPMPDPAPNPAVTVPAVIGRSSIDAVAIVQASGLTTSLEAVDVFSDAGARKVAIQTPAAGTVADPGTMVRLGVATGRVAIPSVAGQPEAQAEDSLHGAGFVVRNIRRRNANFAHGFAIRTNPGAGTVLPAASSIELYISQGP